MLQRNEGRVPAASNDRTPETRWKFEGEERKIGGQHKPATTPASKPPDVAKQRGRAQHRSERQANEERTRELRVSFWNSLPKAREAGKAFLKEEIIRQWAGKMQVFQTAGFRDS